MSCYWGKSDLSKVRVHKYVMLLGEEWEMAVLKLRKHVLLLRQGGNGYNNGML